MTPILFEPLRVGNVPLCNRIAVSSMSTYNANPNSHTVTTTHISHYSRLAAQHPGLIVLESTSVSKDAIFHEGDLGIWNEEQARGLKEVVDAIHKHNVPCCIQLNHPGRKSIGNCVVAPSEIHYMENSPKDKADAEKYKIPHALTRNEIDEIIDDYVLAAKRAASVCGADIIEIACCNGNLLHQFISKNCNLRDDEYGILKSDINNLDQTGGTSILLKIIKSIRQKISTPLFVKLAICDNIFKNEILDDTLQLCQALSKIVDLIDVTSGGISPQSQPRYLLNNDKDIPGQVPLAQLVKQNTLGTKCFIGCSGGLNHNIKQLNQYIKLGQFDIAFIGKAFIEQSNFMETILDQF